MDRHRLPLDDRSVVITRARAQAEPLAQRIRLLGGTPVLFPVIATDLPADSGPLDEAIDAIERYRWLIFTSRNGVDFFLRRVAERSGRSLAGLKIVAVGPATAAALGTHGLVPALVPEQFRGASLPALLRPHLAPGDRVLMARGDLADPAHAVGLRALGAVVDDVVTYCTVLDTSEDAAVLAERLAAGEIDYITFTSASTVQNLVDRLGLAPLRCARIACIGPETQKAAEALGLRADVVGHKATADGLVEAIVADVLTDSAGSQ